MPEILRFAQDDTRPRAMITAEHLRDCRGVFGASELFRQLGYPVLLQRLDPSEWPKCSVSLHLDDGWTLFHGSRIGPLDLFFVDADAVASRQMCGDFVSQLRRWNVLARPVVVAGSDGRLAIHGADGSGKLRRLDIDVTAPRPDALDRLNLLALQGTDSFVELRRRFDRAFERESITSRFFAGFRIAVEQLSAEIHAQCNDNPDAERDEALLILSRLLFLYFVQQKGWLAGNRRFLADHLEITLAEERNYFGSVLQPLFFGCLNTPTQDRDARARELGDIPYLNGGLFDRSQFELRHPALGVSNALLADIVENLFEQYSFCVDEGDAGGLHVDPEMLGKVFESLMADEERLASGTYYTPKVIVDSITENAILAWCAYGDRSIEAALRSGDALDSETASRVVDRLGSIKVVDPACGSGAFLLSALHLIEKLIRTLAPSVPSNLRQRIVERSLFGVDIKPEAVRLCELRLWLSIVSSSDAAPGTVEPLPNLDRNILQGNALLAPLDFLGTGRREVYHRWAYAVRARRELFDRYRRAMPNERPALCRAIRESDQSLAIALLGSALKADREELERISRPADGLFGPISRPDTTTRAQLEARIQSTEAHLSRVQEGVIDFFAFDLHFADVFAAGGFDVVLGNPPWVRSSRVDADVRRTLAERYELYQSGRGFDQSDVCVAFWEKAFSIAADGGLVAMLIPSKLLTASYGAALRAHIHRHAQLIEIEDWTDRARDLFDADTFPVALTVAKQVSDRSRRVVLRSRDGTTEIDPSRLPSGTEGSAWRVVPPDVLEVLDSIRSRHRAATDVLGRRALMGIKTGANERFFLDSVEFRNGSVRVPSLELTIPAEGIARCVRGRDIERWKITGATWMMLPPRHLSARRNAWVARAADALRISPEQLRLAYVQPEHFGIKVAWKDLSCGLQAVVLPSTTEIHGRTFHVVPNQTLYFFEAADLQEAYALSAILNSTIFNALIVSTADRAKDSHFRYFGQTVAAVPLPRFDSRVRTLARLARRAHRETDVAEEIDRLVTDLYRVTRNEFRVLASFLFARLGRR